MTHATVISIYALMNLVDTMEIFYEQQNDIILHVHYKDRFIILDEFNTGVGKDHITWPRVLGHHGTSNSNSVAYFFFLCVLNTSCPSLMLFSSRLTSLKHLDAPTFKAVTCKIT